MSKHLISYACFAGAVFFGLMLYIALFRWEQAKISMARQGRTMPRWAAIALTLGLTVTCLWIGANYDNQAHRAGQAQSNAEESTGRAELVMIDPSAPPPKPTPEQIAAANAALELMQRIDVLVSAGRLADDRTYYRTFDTPITDELKKWRDDWPLTNLGLCSDALTRLQFAGATARDRTLTKYAEQDWEKYQHLKRRCKAAIAGDIAEAERRS